MTTFERYFIDDEDLQKETLNPFYELRKKEWFADRVKDEFDIEEEGHIIIGHTPDENEENLPIMSKGKIIQVNGGRPKMEHNGGFTLLYDSYGMQFYS
jgi:Uncharacterized protein conserved in bacteria